MTESGHHVSIVLIGVKIASAILERYRAHACPIVSPRNLIFHRQDPNHGHKERSTRSAFRISGIA